MPDERPVAAQMEALIARLHAFIPRRHLTIAAAFAADPTDPDEAIGSLVDAVAVTMEVALVWNALATVIERPRAETRDEAMRLGETLADMMRDFGTREFQTSTHEAWFDEEDNLHVSPTTKGVRH